METNQKVFLHSFFFFCSFFFMLRGRSVNTKRCGCTGVAEHSNLPRVPNTERCPVRESHPGPSHRGNHIRSASLNPLVEARIKTLWI